MWRDIGKKVERLIFFGVFKKGCLKEVGFKLNFKEEVGFWYLGKGDYLRGGREVKMKDEEGYVTIVGNKFGRSREFV